MANAVRGNKIYIDSTGAVATTRKKIVHILFTPDTANDQLILRETASDVDVLILRSSTAKTTIHFDLQSCPIVFENGIYVQTLTAGAKATLITSSGG